MITLLIIGITVITSMLAMNDMGMKYRLMFNPVKVEDDKEWYRFLSSGLIHADFIHLGVNMFVLYMFGTTVEDSFDIYFGGKGRLFFVLLYVLSLAASHTYSYFEQRGNASYNSLGASGAVSAVLFAYIIMYPTNMLYIYGIIPMPAFVLGFLYLAYSVYMGKKNVDNIGHEAHFSGAIFGLIFTIVLKPGLVASFFEQIKAVLFL